METVVAPFLMDLIAWLVRSWADADMLERGF